MSLLLTIVLIFVVVNMCKESDRQNEIRKELTRKEYEKQQGWHIKSADEIGFK